MRKEKLYIPTKILDSDDYVAGFGNKELIITAFATAGAIIAGVAAAGITKNNFNGVMLTMGIVIFAIFLVRRDMCNENVFQKIRILMKNAEVQKQYKYQYTNIYENIYGEITDDEEKLARADSK